MTKKKNFMRIFVIITMFIMLFSFSMSYAAVTQEQMQEINDTFRTNTGIAGAFEMTLAELCLAVGDFFMNYLTIVLGEDVTIDKIIFNEVSFLNANFFVNMENSSTTQTTQYIRDTVNAWYDLLRKDCFNDIYDSTCSFRNNDYAWKC